MTKYLDQTGLRYFWEKIKAKLNGPLQAYPVGSVYISISSNFNPNTSFGGTWERFGQGRTLIGEGTGNDGSTSMSFTTGSTGGEYKHSLTKKEMPSHFHETVKGKDDGSTPNISDRYITYQSEISIPIGSYYSAHTREEGGNEPHNNIQPYITVYFWKRTA